MMKFRSVCGYEAEIKETSGERGNRLLVPGQKLYQASKVFREVEIREYEVIATHKREVYIYPTAGDKVGTYPGKLVGWKSIVFNDSAKGYFEHPEDAINMFLAEQEGEASRTVIQAKKALEKLNGN